MRKFTAILLVLALAIGLFGCSSNKDQNKKSEYTVSDLLIYKAEEIARQIGMCSEEAYLSAMEFPAEVVSLAGAFGQAATDDPVHAMVQTGVVKTMSRDIADMCNHIAGTNKLAACSALAVNDHIFMAQKLEKPTAVYLRYSENCHFIVVFTPLGDNLASVWAYPLYAEVAEKVLLTYFAGSTNMDAKQIRAASKAGSKGLFLAQCTDQKTTIGYYADLATFVLKKTKPLNKAAIAEYTTDESIIKNVLNISQLMSKGLQTVHIYRFPSRLEDQVSELLKDSSYSEELEAYTRQQVYLTFPQQLCNNHGTDWIAINSILSAEVNTGNMSAIASAEEQPVLVMVSLRGGLCLLMSIYPSQHQIYEYRYVVLPMTYPLAHNMLLSMGATKMR